MENMELTCFQMISNAGMAKSSFVEAIHNAEAGNFEEAQKNIDEGKEALLNGHKVHAQLIQNEAAGAKTETSLLLLHAEDQMMSCEIIQLMAEAILRQSRRIAALEAGN